MAILLRRVFLHVVVWAATFFIVVSSGGCQPKKPSPIPPPRTAMSEVILVENYPSILLRDGLHKQLTLLEEPNVKAPTASSTLSVRVRLRSVADKTLLVRYRFRFYGADREVLTPNPVWYTVDIPSTHDRTFEARALQHSAAQWELEVAKQ